MKRKQNRRTNKIRRYLQEFKVIYCNVRGLKSKERCVATLLQETNPKVFCAVETHLAGKEEKMEFEGYATHRLDGTNDSKGILIAIKEELESVTVELEDFTEVGQIKWLKIDNTRVKLRLGVVYAPQESRTLNKELKKMYENIEKNAAEAEEERSLFVVMGDFNCKVGSYIRGNNETVTKGGRLLMKMTSNNDLDIVNTSEKTEGLWTRIQGKEMSVLDYVVVNKEVTHKINSLEIDEDRLYGIYREADSKRVYTDHNTMTLEMRIETRRKEKLTSRRISQRRYKAYQENLRNTDITKMFRRECDFQEEYDRWSKLVEDNIEKVTTKVKKRKRKDER